jgi:hypothetical protein
MMWEKLWAFSGLHSGIIYKCRGSRDRSYRIIRAAQQICFAGEGCSYREDGMSAAA